MQTAVVWTNQQKEREKNLEKTKRKKRNFFSEMSSVWKNLSPCVVIISFFSCCYFTLKLLSVFPNHLSKKLFICILNVSFFLWYFSVNFHGILRRKFKEKIFNKKLTNLDKFYSIWKSIQLTSIWIELN